MSSVNARNFSFIILLLIVLGLSFGLVYAIGTFDSSSMYTRLFYGDNEEK